MRRFLTTLAFAAIMTFAFLLCNSAEAQEKRVAATSTDAAPIREIPASYTQAAQNQGAVVRFDYKTAAEDKYALVYLPYGYDKSRQYDIFYMMHGGGGSQESLFDGAGRSNDIKNAIDHLIENGEMRELIIVTPTFYTARHSDKGVSGSWDAVRAFPDELTGYLMPAVESAYSTYAPAADSAGFIASREHRAFGGFSMGSVTTWYVFQNCLNYFSVYIPISGDSWAVAQQGGGSAPDATAAALAESVAAQGFTFNAYTIYAMTGSADIAEPQMTPMLAAMKRLPAFSGANTVYRVKAGGVHTMSYVKEYLFNALPALY